jgi:hypothetical protein
MSLAAVRTASLEALRARAGELSSKLQFSALEPGGLEETSVLPFGIPAIDQALPDGGLPRGAVVELTSNRGLGRATSFALSACAAAQRLAKLRSGDDRTIGAWCAFVDPWRTLNAPGVAHAGVDLDRLLVVRPSVEAITRVAVRAASSRAFSMIAIDTLDLRRSSRIDKWTNVVRRMAIAIEGTDSTVLLLTDSSAPRSVVLPTALRIELDVIARDSLRGDPGAPPRDGRPISTLRIAKDRRGRVSGPIAIAS